MKTRKQNNDEAEFFEVVANQFKSVYRVMVLGIFGKHELKTQYRPLWWAIEIAILVAFGYGWMWMVDLVNHVRWGM